MWFRHKWFIPVAGLMLGMAGGLLYWQQIGCVSGSCPITSSPWISSGYGGMMGYLLAGIVQPSGKSEDT